MGNHIKLKFLKPGLLTLVVDGSRIGYQKYGVPVGGAMDTNSSKMANWLVGNDAESALLEINLAGPKIQFEHACQIALTGADISANIDGLPVDSNTSMIIEKGSILHFGELKKGCRAYLSIRCKWLVKNWLDSNSPFISSTKTSLNGIEIEPCEDFIPIRSGKKSILARRSNLIGVMRGPEYDQLDETMQTTLETTEFSLLPASNRMGYRLSPKLPKPGSSIISSGVVPGTLQITQDGYPLLLMKDGPSTGGYLRALNVISEDMSYLGQLKSGDTIRFKIVK